jgi:hypothetical protein
MNTSDKSPYIKTIQKDTPAHFSDLECGDRIDSINCIPTIGKSLKDIQTFMSTSNFMDIQYSRNELSRAPPLSRKSSQNDSEETLSGSYMLLFQTRL